MKTAVIYWSCLLYTSHPADAGGVSADVLRQRFAAERASAVAQADQRVDGQIKGTVHPSSLLHKLVGPVDDAAEVVDALIPQRQQLFRGILAAAAATAVDQQRGFLVGESLGHFTADAFIGDKDGVFNMPAVVFLTGCLLYTSWSHTWSRIIPAASCGWRKSTRR